MDFETLLRKRNQQGEHLIGLWLCEATSTNREENEQLKKKITQVKRDLKEMLINQMYEMDEDDVMYIWNDYAYDCRPDDVIYENNEDVLNELFSHPSDANGNRWPHHVVRWDTKWQAHGTARDALHRRRWAV